MEFGLPSDSAVSQNIPSPSANYSPHTPSFPHPGHLIQRIKKWG